MAAMGTRLFNRLNRETMLNFLKRHLHHKDPKTSQKLELEISTRCSVRCPLCPRTNPWMGDRSWDNGFIDFDVIEKFLHKSPNLKRLIFCGGYGDPIYHPDFIQIIKTLAIKFPERSLYVETNGSYMKESWWESLGRATSENHKFSFSIDGLKDTNPIYRVNADWDSIISGVKTFRLYHKGKIQWKWILFRHNQHQVEEAYRLSKKLGFDSFKLVQSERHTAESRPTLDVADLHQKIKEIRLQESVQ